MVIWIFYDAFYSFYFSCEILMNDDENTTKINSNITLLFNKTHL